MMTSDNRNPLSNLIPLLFVIFIDTVGYFVVIPVVERLFLQGDGGLIPLSSSIAYRDNLFSLALTLSPLAFIICSPFIGHLSDRFGRKIILTGALFFAALGFFLPIIGIKYKTLSLIFIGRFIAGASSSSQPLAQAGVTDFTTGKQRAIYLSLIGFAMTLGMVIGPLSGSYLSDATLVSWFNTTTPYWFAFALSILNIILILLFYSDDTQTKIKTVQPTTTQAIKKFITLATHNQIGLLMITFLFLEIAWAQYYQSSFFILNQHYHYSTNQVSIFAAFVGLWMCLGLSVIYKWLTKRFDIQTIAYGSLTIATTSFLLCNIPNIIAQWILMIPTTICIGTAYPSLLSLMSHRTTADHQGYVLGCASTILGIAWMITGAIAGPLAHHWFAASTILASISMFISYILIRFFSASSCNQPSII